MSELFGLKWKDVDFDANEISVVRSIVMQVTGPCKTESSQKPIPLDPYLAEALRAWLEHVRYNRPEDWVFANPRMKGRQPYWGQEIMRRVIRPIPIQLGITKHIGWHTFRHTYSTLLRANRADIKVMQELLRHASSRVTMDTYTQAVTAQKRKAQSGVIRLLRVRAMAPTTGARVCAFLCLRKSRQILGNAVVERQDTQILRFCCSFLFPRKTATVHLSG